jgi:hypothetical protein
VGQLLRSLGHHISHKREEIGIASSVESSSKLSNSRDICLISPKSTSRSSSSSSGLYPLIGGAWGRIGVDGNDMDPQDSCGVAKADDMEDSLSNSKLRRFNSQLSLSLVVCPGFCNLE